MQECNWIVTTKSDSHNSIAFLQGRRKVWKSGGGEHCTGSWLALSFGDVIVKMIDLSKTATRDFFDIILDQKYPQELYLLLKYW